MNWLQKIAQQYLFVQDTGKPEDELREIFMTEYVLGELNLRMNQNPRLEFNKRFLHWQEKLRNHARELLYHTVNVYIEQFESLVSEHLEGFNDSEVVNAAGQTAGELRQQANQVIDLLSQSLDSNGVADLNKAFIGMNMALQMFHINNDWLFRMELPDTLLDELSNLPTKELDNWINTTIGVK
jgi:hypothetical protein